jgi:hypothetical protein
LKSFSKKKLKEEVEAKVVEGTQVKKVGDRRLESRPLR